MKITDWIRRGILKLLGIEHLLDKPKNERLTYISEEESIIKSKLNEYKIWYYGDSDELLNFYTQQVTKNNSNPIYNRNKKDYFWAISSTESNIKRVHSGIPNAIVTTLVNAIGVPNIKAKDSNTQLMLENIINENDMIDKINQQQMPLTMVEGWGAFKISIDEMRKIPYVEYYTADRVEYVYKSGVLIGIIYKDYYKYNDKNYMLLEIRRIDGNNSYIEYELYLLKENDEAEPCELSDIPELAELKPLVLEGVNVVLGVASKYFYDVFNKNYGKSIFTGKIDLFDDLDQTLSQDSQSVRVSTPVEYFPDDLLDRTKEGEAKLPNVYNRQYVAKPTGVNGDGGIESNIQTTQPTLNFAQYSEDAKSKLDYILTGILSPATMGIDVAKKDNAEAQREKEKVTIMTRNNIIAKQTKILKELYSICLMMQEYISTGFITKTKYEIDVVFEEFANPSFENQLEVLGGALTQDQISPELYVELLWGEKLTDDKKNREIAWIRERKEKDDISFSEINDGTDI